MANELKINNTLVSCLYMPIQLAISLGFIYLTSDTLSAHWIYLITILIVFALGYALFMKNIIISTNNTLKAGIHRNHENWQNLLESLLEQAKTSPRLRQNYDLRTTKNDSSKRSDAQCPPAGTQIPIHRNRDSIVYVVILKGRVEVIFYDGNGVGCDRILLDTTSEYSRACIAPKEV